MQLTRHTDIALKVLMYLSVDTNPVDRNTVDTNTANTDVTRISALSQAYNVSNNHMVRVVHKLVKLGYLTSIRGRNGGVKLAKPAKQITVGEVVRQTETQAHIIDCDSVQCPLLPACKLQTLLNKANENFFATLDAVTLDDLIIDNPSLLEFVG